MALMSIFRRGGIVLLVVVASACGGYPNEPTYVPPRADCEYYDTGTLLLLNLAETLTPRDAYVDGHFVGVVPYGNQIAVTVNAGGVIHTVEWVSTLSGRTVDSLRLVVRQCSTVTVTNDF